MRGDSGFDTSVLLPVFLRQDSADAIRLLRRALESVHQQTFPGAYEIVLIDDGSPTPIESLRPAIGPELLANARILRLYRNNGIVHALNTGLNQSRYPFIARIDADDRWLPGKIAKQFALFRADPDLSITATGMTTVDPSFAPIDEHVRPGDWAGILAFFIDVGCPFPHGSVLARREVWRLLGGYSHDPAVAHCEDYALWGTWLRFFKPAMVEESLYHHTISGHSVSAIHSRSQRQASGRICAKFGALDPVARVPSALTALAEATSLSLLEAGKLAYLMWTYRLAARVPRDAFAPLQRLMPDRLVTYRSATADRVVEIERLVERNIDPPSREMACVLVR